MSRALVSWLHPQPEIIAESFALLPFACLPFAHQSRKRQSSKALFIYLLYVLAIAALHRWRRHGRPVQARNQALSRLGKLLAFTCAEQARHSAHRRAAEMPRGRRPGQQQRGRAFSVRLSPSMGSASGVKALRLRARKQGARPAAKSAGENGVAACPSALLAAVIGLMKLQVLAQIERHGMA